MNKVYFTTYKAIKHSCLLKTLLLKRIDCIFDIKIILTEYVCFKLNIDDINFCFSNTRNILEYIGLEHLYILNNNVVIEVNSSSLLSFDDYFIADYEPCYEIPEVMTFYDVKKRMFNMITIGIYGYDVLYNN